MQRIRQRPVFRPNLGLYLGISPSAIPERAMSRCLNVRIYQGKVVHDAMGWKRFPSSALNLDDPVMLLDQFVQRNGITKHIWGTTRDIYLYDEETQTVSYLTPRHNNGTVSVTNNSATVTGTSTAFATNVKAGDAIFVGDSDMTAQSPNWYIIESVDSATQLTLDRPYTGATQSARPYTVRKRMTGDLTHALISEKFYDAVNVSEGSDGDRWYVTNGVDPIMAWDGQSDQLYYPDLGDISAAVYIRRFSNTMHYLSPVASGELRKFSVRTSSIGEPENVVDGEAAEFVIHDGSDPLLRAEPLGELMAYYGERSITLAQFVGPPLMYVFRPAVTGEGPLATRALAAFPDAHYFLGRDSQYVFDGARAAPINQHVWRDVIRRMTPERYGMIQSYFDEERGDLLWSVPLTGDPNPADGPCRYAYVHHYLEQTGEGMPDAHTFRQAPFTAFGHYMRQNAMTWDQLTEPWNHYSIRWNDRYFFSRYPLTLAGDEDGRVWEINTINTGAGEPLESYAMFARRQIGSPETAAVLRRAYPFMEQTSSGHMINVRIWGSETPDGRRKLLAQQTLDMSLPESRRFVALRVSARYAEVELAKPPGADNIGYWATSGYDWEIVRGSSR